MDIEKGVFGFRFKDKDYLFKFFKSSPRALGFDFCLYLASVKDTSILSNAVSSFLIMDGYSFVEKEDANLLLNRVEVCVKKECARFSFDDAPKGPMTVLYSSLKNIFQSDKFKTWGDITDSLYSGFNKFGNLINIGVLNSNNVNGSAFHYGCKWAYIVNLDTGLLEFYSSDESKCYHLNGRYAKVTMPHSSMLSLVAEVPLQAIYDLDPLSISDYMVGFEKNYSVFDDLKKIYQQKAVLEDRIRCGKSSLGSIKNKI